jgi:hypothetical protein
MMMLGQEIPKILCVDSTENVKELKDLNSFHFSSVDLSSGKGAITSGTFIFVNFENKKSFLNTTTGPSDIEITYLRRFCNDKILVGPNVGYFFNVPYMSVQVILSPFKFIETLHWVGWSFGKPNEIIELKPGFLISVNAISLKSGRFKATYTLINYMKNLPQHTATLKYTQKINTNFTVYTDVGYDFLHKNQLLQIGVNYKISR